MSSPLVLENFSFPRTLINDHSTAVHFSILFARYSCASSLQVIIPEPHNLLSHSRNRIICFVRSSLQENPTRVGVKSFSDTEWLAHVLAIDLLRDESISPSAAPFTLTLKQARSLTYKLAPPPSLSFEPSNLYRSTLHQWKQSWSSNEFIHFYSTTYEYYVLEHELHSMYNRYRINLVICSQWTPNGSTFFPSCDQDIKSREISSWHAKFRWQ